MRARSALFAVASAALVSALAVLPGCSTAEDDVPPTCQPGATETYVITALNFTRESPRGVAPGFDLDGRTSGSDEQASCGKADMTSPDGQAGIDNQLAQVLPDVEKQVGNAVDGIIQGAINDGRLLVALEVANLNDTKKDECVDLHVKLLDGKPTLGTDGVVEAYQTFDPRKEGQLESHAVNGATDGDTTVVGKIDDGQLLIGPFELRIPIAIFDVAFTIHMRKAYIRMRFDEEGNAEGMLGGGVSMDEIVEGVRTGAGVERIIGPIRAVGKAVADLAPNDEGVCTLVSAALTFKARRAFLRPPETAPATP